MSPSVAHAPEWITISSGRVVPATARAAVAFLPGAGNAGGVAIASTGRSKRKSETKGNQRSLGDTADDNL